MTHDFSLFQALMKGGWTIGLLILISIVVFAVLYERWNFYRSHFKRREEVMAGLEPFLNRKNFQECFEACERNGTLLAKVVEAGLKAKGEKMDLTQAMEREAKIQLFRLEARLPLLATIGSIAPFFCLFCTVLRIIPPLPPLLF